MPEPITVAVAAGLASAVSSAVTLSRFVHDLQNTPDDIKTCLSLLSRVDEDIQFLITLRTSHLDQLSSTPGYLKHMDNVLAQASEGIVDVGRLLEGCRAEANGGRVPMRGRMKWVLGDSAAFGRRSANLGLQHAAVQGEIAYLRLLETVKPVTELVTTTFENAEFLGRRRSYSKLSSPSYFGEDAARLPEYSESTPIWPMSFETPPPLPARPQNLPASNTHVLHKPTQPRRSDAPSPDPYYATHPTQGRAFEIVVDDPGLPYKPQKSMWKDGVPEVIISETETDRDDPQIEFFMDLRRKEMEKQLRRASRML